MNLFDPANLICFNERLAELDSTLSPVAIKKIFVGNGARKELFSLIDSSRRILLVIDDTRICVNGADLKKEIEEGLLSRKIGFEKMVFKNKDVGIKILIPKEMEFAFGNAHFIRRRFTLADLFFFLNKLDSRLYKSIAERVTGE